MKNLKVILMSALIALSASKSYAAFPVASSAKSNQQVTSVEAAAITDPSAIADVKAMDKKEVKALVKKSLKADGPEISKGLYIILAILGWGFLPMGIMDDWKGKNWVIALVLSLLFWIPGVIYSLIKMKDYYK